MYRTDRPDSVSYDIRSWGARFYAVYQQHRTSQAHMLDFDLSLKPPSCRC